MASIATLVDPFNQVTLNAGLWTQFTGGSATLAYAAGGATMTYPASTTSSTDGDISSNVAYDLTGAFGALQVLQTTSDPSCDNTLRIGSTTNGLQIQKEGTSIFFSKFVAGSHTNIFSTTYSAVSHLWWRIREGGGTTFWETSADGLIWTAQTSATNPITVTSLSVLIAGTAFSTATSPGTFKWNNFNSLPMVNSVGGSTSMMMGV